jgi:hypothetical protein
MDTKWHFPVMILASLAIFLLIIRAVLSGNDFKVKQKQVILLALLTVVMGMLIGKYGAMYGLPWWIYYPVPMLMTVLLPPLVLKFNKMKTVVYLLLSFLSAPFIHAMFSFFLGWNEFMPFWEIPYMGDL